MNEKKEKIIDWEERRFEVLKALIAANSSMNLRSAQAINTLLATSQDIIDRYRNSVENSKSV